ncbi:MAG: C69 family dipeptidase [Bacteroidales bacterium]|nr:C69 family dipeptidase [Bacteroidales bacterium]
MKTTTSIIVIFLIFIGHAFACTDIVVGKKASTDGSVILSHTECGSDCRIRVVPAQDHKVGEMVPVYWGLTEINGGLEDYGEILGYIPQVEHTYKYFHSAYSHMNEHQLAFAESTLSQREELKVTPETGKQIMTIEQAQIFALQRCKTAEEALGLITHLMDTYGFLPSCITESEALVIADPNEVWILEVFSIGIDWKPESGKPGAVWAAKRLPDDHVTIIPNWSIIKEIDIADVDNYKASTNYMSLAIEKGWYDPEGSMPFIWQQVYSPTPREWATGRFWMFYSSVAPNLREWPQREIDSPFGGQQPYVQYVEPLSSYPFSVKPEKKLSVKDVQAFQRTVFEGTIYDMCSDPDWFIPDGKGGAKLSPLATPFPTKDMRDLLDINRRRNVVRTGYGMIAQLRSWLPNEIGGVYWIYQDNQYTSPYVPIYAGVTETADVIKTYNAKEYSNNSFRWAVDFVDNLLYLKWQEAAKDMREVRDSLEKDFFGKQDEIEKQALELYKKKPAKAQEFLTNYSMQNMNRVVQEYNKLAFQLLVKYSNNNQGS